MRGLPSPWAGFETVWCAIEPAWCPGRPECPRNARRACPRGCSRCGADGRSRVCARYPQLLGLTPPPLKGSRGTASEPGWRAAQPPGGEPVGAGRPARGLSRSPTAERLARRNCSLMSSTSAKARRTRKRSATQELRHRDFSSVASGNCGVAAYGPSAIRVRFWRGDGCGRGVRGGGAVGGP